MRKLLSNCFKAVLSFVKFINKHFMFLLSGFKCYRRLFSQFMKYTKKMNLLAAIKLHLQDVRKAASKNVIKIFKFSYTSATIAALVMVGFFVFSWSNMTFALKVNYGGSVIGYVQNENVVDQAVDIMSFNIACDDASLYIYDTKFSMGVTSRSNVESAEEIAQTAIESTSELQSAYGLYINDVLYTACDDKSSIENVLSEILNNSATDQNVEVGFVQDIAISNAYFPVNTIISNENVDQVINNQVLPLSVKVTTKETYTLPIAYNTEKIEDANKAVGYEKVSVSGVEGTQLVTAMITYVDGVEVERTVSSEETITEPTTKVIVYGTKEVTRSSSQKLSSAITSNGSMIWPVKSNSKMYISTYFGEGRHKGIDITSPRGNDIYAADAGVVTFAGWGSNGYGNYIVIKHGDNKTETLYGHCSKLFVSVGDTVSAGQVIAAVGSTGQSTGNHLHFEVIVNGVKVNPLGYVKK